MQIFTSVCCPHPLFLSLSLQKQVQRESWTSILHFMLSICLILWIKETLFFGYQSNLDCTIWNWWNLGLKWKNPRICSFMSSFCSYTALFQAQKIAKHSFVCVFFGSHWLILVKVSNTLIIYSPILILEGQTHSWNSNFHLLQIILPL